MVSLAGLWPCGGKSGIPVLFKIAVLPSVSIPQGGCGISYALAEHHNALLFLSGEEGRDYY